MEVQASHYVDDYTVTPGLMEQPEQSYDYMQAMFDLNGPIPYLLLIVVLLIIGIIFIRKPSGK